MKTYYHVSSKRYEGDKLLHTGKVGYDYCCYASSCDVSTFEKYVDCYRNLCLSNVYAKTQRTASKWICEYIFENVRKNKYSHLPSRLWGLYLTSSFQEAKEFLYAERNYANSTIFEIKVPNESEVHCFDMNIFTNAHINIEKEPLNPNFYNRAFELANEYWESDNKYTGTKEYIVDDESLVIGKELLVWSPQEE